MSLSKEQAIETIVENIPDGEITGMAEYKGLFIFRVIGPDLDEGWWDPFYSVDPETGVLEDFSITEDGNTTEILNLLNA